MIDPTRLHDVFDQAVAVQVKDRPAFLAQACGADSALLREVERLLAGHARVESVFDSNHAGESADDSQPASGTRRMSLASGARLGPYHITGPLGAGGMGEVYQARDSRLDRVVALKILPSSLTRDPEARQRFEREARAAAALSHPHICTLLDIGRQDDVDYLVMEYLDGETLATRLTRGKLPLEQALTYGMQIAEALAAAHRAHIIHRDLKPGNIMLTTGGAKLLDFGLAKWRQPPVVGGLTVLHQPSLTRRGTIVGTVQYMAPEQLQGQDTDERTDVFAFGVLLYEMLTGRKAFEGTSDASLIGNILHAEPPSLSSVEPSTPPALDRLIRACLVKDPGARCQSVAEVQTGLTAVREIVRAPTRGSDSGPRSTATGVRTQRWFVPTVLGAIVFALAAAGWQWSSKRGATSEPQRPFVAVRAFRNLSPEPSPSYFAAGMTEEIAGQLSQLSGLRLLSRSAVDRYSDVRSMAKELGVSSVVEGSVRLDGNRVRIAVQLIDPTNQQTLWSEQYDRELTDIFTVQSDVALRIAAALQASLSPVERVRVEKRPTQNLEAYQLYLQSRSATSDRSRNLEEIDRLRKAIALDSSFAAARAQLAYHLIFRGQFESSAYVDEGIAEAEKTLRTDPLLPAGHSTLAFGFSMKGLDKPSRLSYLRALELAPSDRTSMNNLSIHDQIFGRFDEALHWARSAFAVSGRRGNDYYHVSVPLFSLRDDDLTWRWLVEGERQFPGDLRVQMMLASWEMLHGQEADAASRMTRVLERAPGAEEVKEVRSEIAFLSDSPDLEGLLEPLMRTSADTPGTFPTETVRLRYAYAVGKRGDSTHAGALLAQAERVARKAVDSGNQTPIWHVELAAIYALKQQYPSAFEALARAYDAGYREYGFLERDPIFSPVHGDQRFEAVLNRMRHDVDAQRQGARDRGLLNLEQFTPRPK